MSETPDFFTVLDRICVAAAGSRTEFARQQGKAPDTLNKIWQRRVIPRPEVLLDILRAVPNKTDRATLLAAWLSEAFGQIWQEQQDLAMSAAITDTALNKDEALLIQTDRAAGGVFSLMASRMAKADANAIREVFSAMLTPPPAKRR